MYLVKERNESNDFEIKRLIHFFTTLQVIVFVLESIIPYSTLFHFGILAISFGLMICDRKSFSFFLSKYLVLYLLFSAFCFLSAFWALDSGIANRMAGSIVKTVLIFYVYYLYYDESKETAALLDSLKWVGYILLAMAVLFYGISGLMEMVKNEERMNNDFINANTIALFAAQSILISVYQFKQRGVRIDTVLLIPSLLIIIITGSRKGLFLAGGGVIIFLTLKDFFVDATFSRAVKSMFKLLIWIVVAVLLFQLPVFDPIRERVESVISGLKGDDMIRSDKLRQKLIDFGMGVFEEHPWKGIGIDNVKILNPYIIGGYMHNNFVELLADTGVIGFILYYLIYFVALIDFFRKKRHDALDALVFTMMMIKVGLDYAMVSYYSRDTFFCLMIYYLNTRRKGPEEESTLLPIRTKPQCKYFRD